LGLGACRHGKQLAGAEKLNEKPTKEKDGLETDILLFDDTERQLLNVFLDQKLRLSAVLPIFSLGPSRFRAC
jgi:hypothetical protein